jgi:hypothetical protein
MLVDPSAILPYDDRHHAAYDALSVAIMAAELLHRRVARGDLDPIRVRADAERLRGAVARAAAAVVAMDLPYRARTEPTDAPAEEPTRPSAPKPNR